MSNNKYKRKFVQQKGNRIEYDPVTVVSEEKLPSYGYGTSSTETFHQTFPTVRKEINEFLNKYKVYISEEEDVPKDKQIFIGPRQGKYYESQVNEKISSENFASIDNIYEENNFSDPKIKEYLNNELARWKKEYEEIKDSVDISLKDRMMNSCLLFAFGIEEANSGTASKAFFYRDKITNNIEGGAFIDRSFDWDHRAYVRSLFSSPKAIGKRDIKGIGTTLLVKITNNALENDKDSVVLTPLNDAVNFYKKLRFKGNIDKMYLEKEDMIKFVKKFEKDINKSFDLMTPEEIYNLEEKYSCLAGKLHYNTIKKEGVGIASNVSTPTFGGSEGEGKELDFFNDKRNSFLSKAWINFDPKKEKPPKGAQVKVGPRGGYYYQGILPGRQKEKEKIASSFWENPGDKKRSLGNMVLPTEKAYIPGTLVINSDPEAELQATWLDKKGRAKYALLVKTGKKDVLDLEPSIAEASRWQRVMVQLGRNLPSIIKKLNRDKSVKDEALILKLQLLTSFRVGSEDDPSGDVRSYGVSTLLQKHVKVNGDKCTIRFIGKDGVKNHRVVVEPDLAKRVNQLKNPNDSVFKTNYKRIDRYIRENLGEYKTHDFRRWNATQLAIEELKRRPMPHTKKEFRKLQIEVGKIVSEYLFNTYNIALKSYICPDVWVPLKAHLIEKGEKIKKESDTKFKPFEDIHEMLECVYYVDENSNEIIEKARIYLSPTDPVPKGKQIQFGPRGGRYYETELEEYKHMWHRVKERKIKEEKVRNALNFLNTKNLPNFDWYYRVPKDGILVGEADRVMTILESQMRPSGIEIKEE